MLLFTKRIINILNKKNLSINKLAILIDYDVGSLNKMIKRKAVFPDPVIEKILPILEVSREEFESWILADKYPKEVLELAVKNKEQHSPDNEKSILSTKIDKLLEQSGMSRTALSKQIIYNQSALNAIITGKRHVSKSALEKLSKFFSIPENEIISWSLADKYSLDILKNALKELSKI